MSPSLLQRYEGCLLGLACGDAVGTTVEFEPRGCFEPVTDMVGGGPFRLRPGAWTDDTSMALCLAESLIETRGFDPIDQLQRYLRWMTEGHHSSTGRCFDIGITTATALRRFAADGMAAAGSTSPGTAGNGSIMRLAPVALAYFPDLAAVHRYSAESSLTTHGAAEAVDCCRLLGDRIAGCLAALPKADVLARAVDVLREPKVQALALRDVAALPRERIVGSGYAVASLEAALWCFAVTNDFESAVLEAANLGDDADTTAAITGQIAGAFYGVQGIPPHWLTRLHGRDTIQRMAGQLLERAAARATLS